MIELPKLFLLLLIGGLVWYAMRWFNAAPPRTGQRPSGSPPPQRAIQDLVACRTCGTYVAAGAGCGRADCPQRP